MEYVARLSVYKGTTVVGHITVNNSLETVYIPATSTELSLEDLRDVIDRMEEFSEE